MGQGISKEGHAAQDHIGPDKGTGEPNEGGGQQAALHKRMLQGIENEFEHGLSVFKHHRA
jgi:hypothetical protein